MEMDLPECSRHSALSGDREEEMDIARQWQWY